MWEGVRENSPTIRPDQWQWWTMLQHRTLEEVLLGV
jgi:hypothetical protein